MIFPYSFPHKEFSFFLGISMSYRDWSELALNIIWNRVSRGDREVEHAWKLIQVCVDEAREKFRTFWWLLIFELSGRTELWNFQYFLCLSLMLQVKSLGSSLVGSQMFKIYWFSTEKFPRNPNKNRLQSFRRRKQISVYLKVVTELPLQRHQCKLYIKDHIVRFFHLKVTPQMALRIFGSRGDFFPPKQHNNKRRGTITIYGDIGDNFPLSRKNLSNKIWAETKRKVLTTEIGRFRCRTVFGFFQSRNCH